MFVRMTNTDKKSVQSAVVGSNDLGNDGFYIPMTVGIMKGKDIA